MAMALEARGVAREGKRPFAKLRNVLTGVEPRPIHIDSLVADAKERVITTRQVPAAEWDGFSRIVAGINQGSPDMAVAQSYLISWGVDSFLSLKRSESRVGKPYKLTANPGLVHIATDVTLPADTTRPGARKREGVQINIERKKQ